MIDLSILPTHVWVNILIINFNAYSIYSAPLRAINAWTVVAKKVWHWSLSDEIGGFRSKVINDEECVDRRFENERFCCIYCHLFLNTVLHPVGWFLVEFGHRQIVSFVFYFVE
jgi:hypothetical protein